MRKIILSGFADEIDMNLTTQMDEFDKHGIKYIEMRGVNDKNIGDVTVEEAKEIKAQLDARGFKISSLGSPIGKIYLKDDFEEHKAKFKRVLEVAEILESKYIRMFSFFMEEGTNHDDYREEVLAKLTELADIAKDYDVTLLHENEKDIYGDTVARCVDLAESINRDNFKLVFDPANYVQCGEDTVKALEAVQKYTKYYHIKDARKSDNVVVPAGEGDGQIPAIIEKITNDGYEGFLSLEPHLGNFAGLAALENTDMIEGMEKADGSTFAVGVKALKEILDAKGIKY